MKNLLICIFLCITVTDVNGVDFYVSSNGDDNAAGSSREPFATIERARDAVRAGLSRTSEDIVVHLYGGNYYLKEPIVFGSRDGHAGVRVRYVAVKGETPVVSGGVPLDLDWRPYKDGIFRAKVDGDIELPDQLFVNGVLQRMARYPNYDPQAKFFGGTSKEAISPGRVKQWADPVGGYMHALHSAMWGSKHYRIAGVDEEGKIRFQGGWQENRGGGWDKYYRGGYHRNYLFVENIFEELDAEGEWYYNAESRRLYLRPAAGVDLEGAEVIAAGLKELFVVKGSREKPVRGLSFDGITFRHTRRVFMEPYERLLRGDWSIARLAAVRFSGCEDCSMRNCSLEDLGGNGVFISGYNRRVDVIGSRFTRLGESGVCLVGDLKAVRSPAISYENTVPQDKIDLVPGPNTPDYPGRCKVHNNLMHRFGLVGKQVAGVFISMAQEITVSHNTIYQCPRAAICINDGCWGGHVIEYNDAFNTVRESGDHGPFNSWGRDRWWKTSYNGGRGIEEFAKERSRLDNWKVTHIRHNRFSHPGGHSWGIDLDDGSSNYHVYGNLCLGMGVKLREGFYRRVENNIIVNGFCGFHIWMPDSQDVIVRNIFVSDKPYQFIRANPAYANKFDYNLFYNEKGRPRITGVGKSMTLTQWRKRGFDEHSVFAEPGFVDPENGDYRVKADSPALKLGFENFPMDRFGVLKAEFQSEAARETRAFKPAATVRSGQSPRSSRKETWLGATVRNLIGEAEKSAAGLGAETGVLILAAPSASRAAQAGFEAGDVILAIDGEKTHCFDDLKRLTDAKNGGKARVTVHRAVETEIVVVLGP